MPQAVCTCRFKSGLTTMKCVSRDSLYDTLVGPNDRVVSCPAYQTVSLDIANSTPGWRRVYWIVDKSKRPYIKIILTVRSDALMELAIFDPATPGNEYLTLIFPQYGMQGSLFNIVLNYQGEFEIYTLKEGERLWR